MGGEQEEKWFSCKFLLLLIDYSAEVWQSHLPQIGMKFVCNMKMTTKIMYKIVEPVSNHCNYFSF